MDVARQMNEGYMSVEEIEGTEPEIVRDDVLDPELDPQEVCNARAEEGRYVRETRQNDKYQWRNAM